MFKGKKKVVVTLMMSMLIVFAAACGNNANSGNNGSENNGGAATNNTATNAPTEEAVKLSGEIKIDGSSTVFPLTEAAAEEFNKEHSDVRVPVGVSGTGGGFKQFCAGEIAIADASRPIKDEEATACKDAAIEYTELSVAFDGLSVVVSKENDFVDHVQGVAGSKYGIGYFGFAYFEENADKLKVVPVDGGSGPIEPTYDTIKDGTYAPLSRPLYIYLNNKELERPEVKEFAKFYIENIGALAGEVGYVSLPDEQYATEAAKIQ
ncbi:substrate-binding domain-containing protein [Paenibacillus sp. MCAF20]